MTVSASGDHAGGRPDDPRAPAPAVGVSAAGDRAGGRPDDPRSPVPAVGVTSPALRSSDRVSLGKFWALLGEDVCSGSEADGDEEAGEERLAVDYLPSSDLGRDLEESLSGLARRAEKRLLRQQRQRLAARDCLLLSPTSKVCSPTSLSSAISRPRSFRPPVLEPSTFPAAADDDEGWTVVQRRRRSLDLVTEHVSDPQSTRISKSELPGSISKLGVDRARVLGRPFSRNVVQREARRSKAQTSACTQKIPSDANIAAGRAWRRKLGFWWARANSSTSGGCDRAGGGVDDKLPMNNAGGASARPGEVVLAGVAVIAVTAVTMVGTATLAGARASWGKAAISMATPASTMVEGALPLAARQTL
jgi:hypothetical protein